MQNFIFTATIKYKFTYTTFLTAAYTGAKQAHYKRSDEVTRKVVRDDPDEKMGRDVQVRDGFGAASPGTRMVPCCLFGWLGCAWCRLLDYLLGKFCKMLT